jgi:hypothetical protein
MLHDRLRSGIAHVGLALRDPEEFALRWHRGDAAYGWPAWIALVLTSTLGTTTYGMTMGIGGGLDAILRCGLACTVAAGLAWAVPLPALYIFNSLSGSRLAASTTLLAAVVTTSWGGLAMIASIPINWFFTAAVPHPTFILVENVVVFTAVGVAMIDVFGRVMRRLEPERGRAPVWSLVLVGVVGIEFFTVFGLFDFASRI